MDSLLRLAPPKQRLAQRAGRWIRPMCASYLAARAPAGFPNSVGRNKAIVRQVRLHAAVDTAQHPRAFIAEPAYASAGFDVAGIYRRIDVALEPLVDAQHTFVGEWQHSSSRPRFSTPAVPNERRPAVGRQSFANGRPLSTPRSGFPRPHEFASDCRALVYDD
jgi:hypothetical protein